MQSVGYNIEMYNPVLYHNIAIYNAISRLRFVNLFYHQSITILKSIMQSVDYNIEIYNVINLWCIKCPETQ